MAKIRNVRTSQQGPYHLTQLRLENWRNFVSVELDLQRRVFLVGPNASGKSNFLDVFRFLHDLVSVGGGFQEAVRKRGGVSSLSCLAARRHSELAVRVTIGTDDQPATWRYELHFSQDTQERPIIKSERVFKQGNEVFVRPDGSDKSDPARLSQTYLEPTFPTVSMASETGDIRSAEWGGPETAPQLRAECAV